MIITIDLLSPKNQTVIAPSTPQYHDRHSKKNKPAIAPSTPKITIATSYEKSTIDRTRFSARNLILSDSFPLHEPLR
jgi:hypothetical protein